MHNAGHMPRIADYDGSVKSNGDKPHDICSFPARYKVMRVALTRVETFSLVAVAILMAIYLTVPNVPLWAVQAMAFVLGVLAFFLRKAKKAPFGRNYTRNLCEPREKRGDSSELNSDNPYESPRH